MGVRRRGGNAEAEVWDYIFLTEEISGRYLFSGEGRYLPVFIRRKEGMTLQEFFQNVPKAAVAFSGGADSAFLLWAAKEYGADVRAYYVRTAFSARI